MPRSRAPMKTMRSRVSRRPRVAGRLWAHARTPASTAGAEAGNLDLSSQWERFLRFAAYRWLRSKRQFLLVYGLVVIRLMSAAACDAGHRRDVIEHAFVIGARVALSANWTACPFDMRFTCYRDLSGGRGLMVHRAIDRLFSICCVVNDISLPRIRLGRLFDSRYRRARR